jgi:hypothetical protein
MQQYGNKILIVWWVQEMTMCLAKSGRITRLSFIVEHNKAPFCFFALYIVQYQAEAESSQWFDSETALWIIPGISMSDIEVLTGRVLLRTRTRHHDRFRSTLTINRAEDRLLALSEALFTHDHHLFGS